jgi:hypothetical protein
MGPTLSLDGLLVHFFSNFCRYPKNNVENSLLLLRSVRFMKLKRIEKKDSCSGVLKSK